MKKQVTMILALLIAGVVTASAQLIVDSSGKVRINRPVEASFAELAVGPQSYNLTGYTFGLYARKYNTDDFLMGVNGTVGSGELYFNYGRAFGVYGIAGGATNGYNYGVLGCLQGDRNGAGVFGSSSNSLGTNLSGKYAGYFDGPLYSTSSVTTPSLITPSDVRQEDNVRSLVEDARSGDETLGNIMNMNVISYQYKDREIPASERDTISAELAKKMYSTSKDLHYGVSAEELQKIYPNLVVEGQDGYLGINYVELVPVLIRAIQELKQELDKVKIGDIDAKEIRSGATAISAVTATANGNVLYQNTPNPFKEKTVIRFSLASDAQNAAVCIFDMSGKMLKKLPVSASDTNISINGYELGEGMFLYSLLVNGQEVDTKRMIITK